MTFPAPKPGLVIRYSFLWSHEQDAGADPKDSLEIPASVARNLGLDGERHWLRLDELNRFSWPSYDLRIIPGRSGSYDYGMLPRPLFEELRQGILERQRAKRGRTQDRG